MEILRSSSRRLVLLLIAAGALAALVIAEVGAAGASPATGPPIDGLSPGEGAAVEASAEPLKVTFSCPSFVYEAGELIEVEEEEIEEEEIIIEEPEEEGEESEEGEEEGEGGEKGGGKEEEKVTPPPPPVFGPPTLGGAENYAVHFSTSQAV